jgi:hypothetical protein
LRNAKHRIGKCEYRKFFAFPINNGNNYYHMRYIEFSYLELRRKAMLASATSSTLDAAIKVGEDLALKVLEYRLGAIKTRAVALEEFEKDLPIDSLTEMKAMPESDFIRNFRDARSRGTLMAEGDSWFDYPLERCFELPRR